MTTALPAVPPLLDLAPPRADFRGAVLAGLRRRPREIPSKFFYDEHGAQLFERICALDEYYLTRTETAILQRYAPEIAATLGRGTLLLEYGSGYSRKTRILLDHLRAPAGYVPIDISRTALLHAAQQLACNYPDLPVHPICADYTADFGLPPALAACPRKAVFFPGSTIGNFTPAEAGAFLGRLRRVAGARSGLLVGVDLQKDPRVLHAAYNDAAGVTAAFNRNLLARINRELSGDFVPQHFAHYAFYNMLEGRIEMHLASLEDQVVQVAGHEFDFRRGESIFTESSYKYTLDGFARLAEECGYQVRRVWLDEQQWFSVQYLVARGYGRAPGGAASLPDGAASLPGGRVVGGPRPQNGRRAMIAVENRAAESWPALPLADWADTCATLHMWTQMVGKVRLALSPYVNHWWQVPLYVSARGLTTAPVPCTTGVSSQAGVFEAEFDFLRHELVLQTSWGVQQTMPLAPRSVADFYREFTDTLHALRIPVRIWPMPVEIPNPIRFDQDRTHASYDPAAVERFWRILVFADAVFREFRGRFIGKCSPVHFFWGSFDLAVTRFSGRRAPERPGADPVTREAYSHEVSSAGFWPGGGDIAGAAFYAYAAPEPAGFRDAAIRPATARYDAKLGEYVLLYEDIRTGSSPKAALLEFYRVRMRRRRIAGGGSGGRWSGRGGPPGQIQIMERACSVLVVYRAAARKVPKSCSRCCQKTVSPTSCAVAKLAGLNTPARTAAGTVARAPNADSHC